MCPARRRSDGEHDREDKGDIDGNHAIARIIGAFIVQPDETRRLRGEVHRDRKAEAYGDDGATALWYVEPYGLGFAPVEIVSGLRRTLGKMVAKDGDPPWNGDAIEVREKSGADLRPFEMRASEEVCVRKCVEGASLGWRPQGAQK